MEEEGGREKKEREERVAIHRGPNYIRIGVFWKDGFLEIDAFAGQFHDQSHVFIHDASPSPVWDVCSVLLSNKDQEEREGGRSSRTEVSNSKQWRRAQSARFDARRGPRKGLYGSILRHSFLSPPPPPASPRSLNSFLSPSSLPSSSALFVSPQRVCSSPRSRGPFSWVTAEGRRRAHRGGEGHKGAAAAGISPLTISSRPCRKIRDTRKSISTVVAPSSPAVKPYYRSLRKIPTRVVSTRSLLFFLFLFSRCLASWVLSIIIRYRRNKSRWIRYF